MSARNWWAIFTVCVIILVQWIGVKPILNYCLNQEIPASMTHTELNNQTGTATETTVKEAFGKATIQEVPFEDKLQWLYKNNPVTAIKLAGSLFFVGLLGGGLLAALAFRHLMNFGDQLNLFSTTDKIAVLIGVIIGISLSAIFLPALLGSARNPTIIMAGGFIITYFCVTAMMSMKEELKFYWPGNSTAAADLPLEKPKILDTNVIIDGRISEVRAAGFVEGKIYVPSFVLEELQHIADSSDSLRRARGRRGLDILNQMRKETDLVVRQCDPNDPENPEEVDARLVKLAREIDASIVTNDFNLNKVAELQGVKVLNINELANALKPVVLPGEIMTVSVIKEGKEMNQGIAYLDDGTMIVVEGARTHIGETVDVIVTSVLQTVAGKMIFANIKSLQEEQDELIDRNMRNYSSVRPRKKTF